MWSVEINSLNRKDMETVVMIRMLNADPAGVQSFKISAQTLGIQICDTCFSKIPFLDMSDAKLSQNEQKSQKFIFQI